MLSMRTIRCEKRCALREHEDVSGISPPPFTPMTLVEGGGCPGGSGGVPPGRDRTDRIHPIMSGQASSVHITPSSELTARYP